MKPEDFVESLLANGCCHDLYFITDEKFQKSRFFSLHGNSTFPQVSLYACLKTNVSPLEFCAHKFWRKNHSKFCFPSNATTLKIESLVFQVNLIHQK